MQPQRAAVPLLHHSGNEGSLQNKTGTDEGWGITDLQIFKALMLRQGNGNLSSEMPQFFKNH